MALPSTHVQTGGRVIDAAGREVVAVHFADGQPAILKSAVVAASADGVNEIVAAVADKKIRVVSYTLVVSAAGGAKWQRGATDLTGNMPLAQNAGAAPSCPPPGWLFETAAGEALNLNTSTGVDAFGHVTYAEVE